MLYYFWLFLLKHVEYSDAPLSEGCERCAEGCSLCNEQLKPPTGDQLRRGRQRHQGKTGRPARYPCQVTTTVSCPYCWSSLASFICIRPHLLPAFENVDACAVVSFISWLFLSLKRPNRSHSKPFFTFQTRESDHLSSWRGCDVSQHHPDQQTSTFSHGNVTILMSAEVVVFASNWVGCLWNLVCSIHVYASDEKDNQLCHSLADNLELWINVYTREILFSYTNTCCIHLVLKNNCPVIAPGTTAKDNFISIYLKCHWTILEWQFFPTTWYQSRERKNI